MTFSEILAKSIKMFLGMDFTHWNCSVHADQVTDRIYFRPSCYGELCDMHFGKYSPHVGWHMTDSELNKFTLAGTMYIGDQDSSEIVDVIKIRDINYYSAGRGIEIAAHSKYVTFRSKRLSRFQIIIFH